MSEFVGGRLAGPYDDRTGSRDNYLEVLHGERYDRFIFVDVDDGEYELAIDLDRQQLYDLASKIAAYLLKTEPKGGGDGKD